jgi:hypothetical protein
MSFSFHPDVGFLSGKSMSWRRRILHLERRILDQARLAPIIAGGENRLVEIKSEWPELTPAGKATFVKHVLALANSASAGEEAFLVFGVEDPGRGGRVLGVTDPPSSEAAIQILADYTTPPPVCELRLVTLGDKTVSVLRIEGSANRPHHAVRQFSGILEPTGVYIRRDNTTGVATTREIEGMLLERIGAHGAEIDKAPIRAGFVGHETGANNRSLIVRITNVVDHAVSGIDVLVDLEHIEMREIRARERLLTGITLRPAESREVEFSLARPIFYHRYFDPNNPGRIDIAEIRDYGQLIGDRWLTARLRVYYRDGEGFLQEIIRELALDSY